MYKLYRKFQKSITGLAINGVISLIAGLSLAITPEDTNLLVIRLVGIGWILQGIIFLIDLWAKYRYDMNPSECTCDE